MWPSFQASSFMSFEVHFPPAQARCHLVRARHVLYRLVSKVIFPFDVVTSIFPPPPFKVALTCPRLTSRSETEACCKRFSIELLLVASKRRAFTVEGTSMWTEALEVTALILGLEGDESSFSVMDALLVLRAGSPSIPSARMWPFDVRALMMSPSTS